MQIQKGITLNEELINKGVEYCIKNNIKFSKLVENLLNEHLITMPRELYLIKRFFSVNSIILKYDEVEGCLFFNFKKYYIQIYATKIPDEENCYGAYVYGVYIYDRKHYHKYKEDGKPLESDMFSEYENNEIHSKHYAHVKILKFIFEYIMKRDDVDE